MSRWPPAIERFWANVKKGDGCWEWQTKSHGQRYGSFRVDGRTMTVHRFSWQHHFGPIPAGLCVCHKCDNGWCVRPDHLFLGTMKDNCQDREAKGRGNQPRGQRQWCAKLTEDDVRSIKRRIAAGESMYKMSKEYGVHRTAIRCIKTGRSWRWVKEEVGA